MPRSIIFDGGFKILGTPLAFKGCRNPGLLFVSDLNMKLPAGTKRVIGSEVAIGTLGRRRQRLDAIAVGFDRLFKLGKMDLRLLPSGMGPGTSLLEIKYNNKTLIYCSGVRTAVPLSGLPVSPVACDILLFDFEIPDTKIPAPRTLKPKLQNWQNAVSGKFAPVILCDSATGVFDAVNAFAGEPQQLYAHSTTYRLLRETAIASREKLIVRRLGNKWPASGVVISSSRSFFKTNHANNAAIPVCFCGSDELAPASVPVFPLGEPDHIGSLVGFAKKCAAHTVAISPAGGENAATSFSKAGFDVFYSRIAHQLKLPL